MMTQKSLKIPDSCVKHLDCLTRQVIFYRNNKKGELPAKLNGRIAYVRGYLNAIREVDKLEREGKLQETLDQLNDKYQTKFWRHPG